MEITNTTIYAIGLPVAFGLIAIEAIYSAWQNKGWYHLGDSLGSFRIVFWEYHSCVIDQRVGIWRLSLDVPV